MKSARFSGAFLSGAFHAPLPKTFRVGTFPAVEALLQEQI